MKNIYTKKTPDSKEFERLSENLSRTFLQINKVYSNSEDITFEIQGGNLFIMKGKDYQGAISGNFVTHEIVVKQLQSLLYRQPYTTSITQNVC